SRRQQAQQRQHAGQSFQETPVAVSYHRFGFVKGVRENVAAQARRPHSSGVADSDARASSASASAARSASSTATRLVSTVSRMKRAAGSLFSRNGLGAKPSTIISTASGTSRAT